MADRPRRTPPLSRRPRPRPGTKRPVEVTTSMFESDARRPLVETGFPPSGGYEDDEPPSQSRRPPIWQDIPDHLWNDAKWQTTNAIRSVRQLRTLLSLSTDELEAIGRLEG